MEELLSGLFSASSGGILGGIFGGVMGLATNFMKERGRDKQHKRDMEERKLQREADNQSHDHDIALSRENASSAARQASYQDAQSPNAPAWAAGIKAVFRPALTTFLLALNGYILTLGETSEPMQDIRDSVVFLTGTAVAWWFGERGGMPTKSK